MRAPHGIQKISRSQISGSRAALVMTVVPCARTEARDDVFGRSHAGEGKGDKGALQMVENGAVEIAVIFPD